MRIFSPFISKMPFVSIDRLNFSPTVMLNRKSSKVLSKGLSPALLRTTVFAPGCNFGRCSLADVAFAIGSDELPFAVAVFAPACPEPQPATSNIQPAHSNNKNTLARRALVGIGLKSGGGLR